VKTKKNERIVPADVLVMGPDEARALTVQLDEANQHVLAAAITRIALSRVLTDAEAGAYAGVFRGLGPARLKLRVWSMLTNDSRLVPRVMPIYRLIAGDIVTGIFGVPLGEAGIGTIPAPQSDADRLDLYLVEHDTTGLLDGYYARIVRWARERGALVVVVDEDPV
jgi:hypothetical protein